MGKSVVVIALAGKGGVGKTVATTGLVKILTSHKKKVLVIDADPASSLPLSLGIAQYHPVGHLREEMKQDSQKRVPTLKGLHDAKTKFEYDLFESMVEYEGFSLLVMGRPEGPGCYCPANHVLRAAIDTLANAFDFVLIDCEAGLEHLSRRTTRAVDIMIVLTDPTAKGVQTARLIKELTEDMKKESVEVARICGIVNKAEEPIASMVSKSLEEVGITPIGSLPFDQQIALFDLEGRPLLELPDDSILMQKLQEIVKRLEIL